METINKNESIYIPNTSLTLFREPAPQCKIKDLIRENLTKALSEELLQEKSILLQTREKLIIFLNSLNRIIPG